jgi:hypothetical protein
MRGFLFARTRTARRLATLGRPFQHRLMPAYPGTRFSTGPRGTGPTPMEYDISYPAQIARPRSSVG